MAMTVAEAVATRRSVRSFADRAVPLATIRRVLDGARMAPSGCNFQPWEAVVLAGEPLAALQQVLRTGKVDEPQAYDFSAPAQVVKYHERLQVLGAKMYGSMGISREATDLRAAFMQHNLRSFGAPAVLLCHFPGFMKEAQWSDVGMWLQTVMLLLRGEGLDSCPQESLGLYGGTIKAHLGLPEDHVLFCGIAIGWRDETAPVNNFPRERVPLDEQVRFLGFE